jgi:hypothetical protein
VNQGQPILSDRTHLENLTQALEHKLETLRRDLDSVVIENAESGQAIATGHILAAQRSP